LQYIAYIALKIMLTTTTSKFKYIHPVR